MLSHFSLLSSTQKSLYLLVILLSMSWSQMGHAACDIPTLYVLRIGESIGNMKQNSMLQYLFSSLIFIYWFYIFNYSFSLPLFIFVNTKYTITHFLLLLKAEQKQHESRSTFAFRKGLLHLRSVSLKRVTLGTIGMDLKLSRHWHKIEELERKRKLDQENLPCLFSNNQWEEQWSYSFSAVSFELYRQVCL